MKTLLIFQGVHMLAWAVLFFTMPQMVMPYVMKKPDHIWSNQAAMDILILTGLFGLLTAALLFVIAAAVGRRQLDSSVKSIFCSLLLLFNVPWITLSVHLVKIDRWSSDIMYGNCGFLGLFCLGYLYQLYKINTEDEDTPGPQQKPLLSSEKKTEKVDTPSKKQK
jgi:drug/metabolite transporter (DMT)-like permease